MLRERGRLLPFIAAVIVAGLILAGCGRNDFKNDPRPPIPVEVSVKIAKDGVAVSPKEFGAGLVNFTIQGPVNADSEEIVPAGTGTIKVDMRPGSYEASVSGVAARPFSFTVGPERSSGQNDLLLP